MPVDMTALAADLAAESAVTRALVAGLDETGWRTPTPAPGWIIKDQISHLAHFDEVAVQSAVRPDEFRAELAAGLDHLDPDLLAARYRVRPGAELLAWFEGARAELLDTFAVIDPQQRLPWFGPAMSAASSLTARLMETWAHASPPHGCGTSRTSASARAPSATPPAARSCPPSRSGSSSPPRTAPRGPGARPTRRTG